MTNNTMHLFMKHAENSTYHYNYVMIKSIFPSLPMDNTNTVKMMQSRYELSYEGTSGGFG